MTAIRAAIQGVALHKHTLDELIYGTDRSVAIVLGALVDGELERLLMAFMVDDKDSRDLFGHSQPLGSLSAKRAMAYSLGLLPADDYRDLDLIRRIRNDFAHDLTMRSFEHDKIRQRVLQMACVQIHLHDARDLTAAYALGCGPLIWRIREWSESIGADRRQVPEK